MAAAAELALCPTHFDRFDDVEAYRHALPFATNVTGLVRYFRNAAKA